MSYAEYKAAVLLAVHKQMPGRKANVMDLPKHYAEGRSITAAAMLVVSVSLYCWD